MSKPCVFHVGPLEGPAVHYDIIKLQADNSNKQQDGKLVVWMGRGVGILVDRAELSKACISQRSGIFDFFDKMWVNFKIYHSTLFKVDKEFLRHLGLGDANFNEIDREIDKEILRSLGGTVKGEEDEIDNKSGQPDEEDEYAIDDEDPLEYCGPKGELMKRSEGKALIDELDKQRLEKLILERQQDQKKNPISTAAPLSSPEETRKLVQSQIRKREKNYE